MTDERAETRVGSGVADPTKLVDDGVLHDGLADLVSRLALGLREVDLRTGDRDGRGVGVDFEFAHRYI
ncbi:MULTISPECIES: hypothetical protein [Halorubrum]|uniref:hypothetical protein n=1 Tax=Halorubrum TaxID=56688 RepID=UPI00130548D1|nr:MULTISPECIES: hypothetical protein [Halorubrum]